MSLADLLPAIRALPTDERRQLVHLLIDELDGPPPPADEVPEQWRDFFRPGAVVHAGYRVTTDAAGFQHFLDAMSESKGAP